MSTSTPVGFIIFNRPDLTEQVFAAIAQAKPKQLFVIADGPRPDRPGKVEKIGRNVTMLPIRGCAPV